MTVYQASITAAVIFGSLAIAVSSATAQKRCDPGASDTEIKIGNTMRGAYRSCGTPLARRNIGMVW
jgi:hypothetical protein